MNCDADLLSRDSHKLEDSSPSGADFLGSRQLKWTSLRTLANLWPHTLLYTSFLRLHTDSAGQSAHGEAHHDLGNPSLAYADMVLRTFLPLERGDRLVMAISMKRPENVCLKG